MLYQSLGAEDSNQLFVWFEFNEHPNYPEEIRDNTHFCKNESIEIDRLVIEGIQELKLPLAAYVK
ncbi:hypothetical protein SFC65_26450 [Priestia filamentosa]|uniref:hypothetical protein n=1 Tax=Priestia filamentosa TaxID=1402861 RepID=UPI003982BE4C